MADIIAKNYRIDRLKTFDLQYFTGSGCTYYLVDRVGRPYRTTFKFFIIESFARNIVSLEPK